MDLINIANEIHSKIGLLEKMRVEIRERAERKAEAGSEYSKKLALTIIQLKNGKIFEIDGEVISGESLPANLVEKIAKGICWQEQLNADKTEGLYKALISNIDAVQSELNGLQSINKNLERI